jgi:predicted nucleotidyltransferase
MLDEVQALLGESVDLVTPDGLSPRFREKVLQEARPL